MIYTQYIDPAFEETIGTEGAGKQEFERSLTEAAKAIEVLREKKKNNIWPVLNCGEDLKDVELIEKTAKHIREHFATMVVLGMGASSRGGNTFAALVENKFATPKGKTKIHFVENIDPVTFEQLLSSVDFKTTLFLVISKSGGTVETMAQSFVLIKEVEARAGKGAAKDHFIFITEPTANPLRQLAEKHGIQTLEHSTKIGGRYAGLTVVGLLPAAVAGLDIRAILHGAKSVSDHAFSEKNPQPAVGAALHNALLAKGKVVAVMMPYCDRLDAFGAWWQQLWEESLGKKGKGTTALRALGAVDQHSQLQLFLDGPNDKFTTFIFLKQAGVGTKIEAAPENKLAYLGGHHIGDLMASFQFATAKTLTKNKRPVRIIEVEKLDEETIGALLMHFMIETIITAHLWNIDAFDQPAVEESKQLAREYLSKGVQDMKIRA